MEVRKLLGRGASGVVHLVETTSPISQSYAVKSAEYALSSSLAKELQILQQFSGCPNIVRCFGGLTTFEPGRGKVFNLYLEYASGGSLLDLMKKYGGKIPECDVKGYARMILEGLVDIHQRGYIHSDLKPGNILVFPSQDGLNTLKIADFGLAKRYGERDIPALWEYGFRGTGVYMSPESVVGKISGALDVWSLGCTVVQMISGKLPLNYRNLEDLRDKLLMGESPKIPEDMSSTGKDFLTSCFARDPDLRWTARQLLSHPFILPEYKLFPFETGPLPQCKPILRPTNFQEKKFTAGPFPQYKPILCSTNFQENKLSQCPEYTLFPFATGPLPQCKPILRPTNFQEKKFTAGPFSQYKPILCSINFQENKLPQSLKGFNNNYDVLPLGRDYLEDLRAQATMTALCM